MLKYRCLVLDHDDTVVQTEKAIGYPYFRDYIARIRPGMSLSYEEYVHDCNNMIFADMCRKRWQFTEAEMLEEYTGWKEYSRKNTPPLCTGIDRIIRRHKELGGILCVASLSTKEIIERDFLYHFGFLPDCVYDYDLPADKRKPSIYAIEDIIRTFNLKPADLLMVDDMKLGWQMAKDCGVATAFAGWSKAEFPKLTEEMTSLCDYAFYTTAQLYNFLFD